MAPPAMLGVVVEADRAHLNSLVVTAGATIYDGDRFSTEAGGLLFLRGDGAMLELAEEGEVILRSRPSGARGMEAELGKGTLNFPVAGTDTLEILAQGARIRSATDASNRGAGIRQRPERFTNPSDSREDGVFVSWRNGDDCGRRVLSGGS